MKINSDAHYTQCLLHDPCDRSRDGSHVAYPENTNGYRWGLCRECDDRCICNRLVDMRNEGRQIGMDAAREAVEAVENDPDAEVEYDRDYAADPTGNCRNPRIWLRSALAAIDALRQKP